MYDAPGIGLAATQVDVHKRLIVIDISENKDQPLVLINPEIIEKDGVEVMEEGCLSVPGIYAKVERAEAITVRALDRDGQAFEMDADGLLAVCIQHEIDHLDGILFTDRLTDPDTLQPVEVGQEEAAELRAEAEAQAAAEL